jgi:hypothetical protein
MGNGKEARSCSNLKGWLIETKAAVVQDLVGMEDADLVGLGSRINQPPKNNHRLIMSSRLDVQMTWHD